MSILRKVTAKFIMGCCSWLHIVQLWSCAWRLHAHMRVRASWACSRSFHGHKCSWELHEHAHGGFTSTMLEYYGHDMGQDNKGQTVLLSLCHLSCKKTTHPRWYFVWILVFVHHHYQANKAKSAKRNSYIWGVNCFGTQIFWSKKFFCQKIFVLSFFLV